MEQDSRKSATAEAIALLRVAEQDWQAVEILSKHPRPPLSVVAFHIQQYTEKVMKAVLVSNAVIFRRTHDLEELAGLLKAQDIDLPLARPLLRKLNPFAVTSRYITVETDFLDADSAMKILHGVQAWLKRKIDVPDNADPR